jgi:histidine transport system permease protein
MSRCFPDPRGLVYLLITTLSNRIFKRLERRYNLGIKGMAR